MAKKTDYPILHVEDIAQLQEISFLKGHDPKWKIKFGLESPDALIQFLDLPWLKDKIEFHRTPEDKKKKHDQPFSTRQIVVESSWSSKVIANAALILLQTPNFIEHSANKAAFLLQLAHKQHATGLSQYRLPTEQLGTLATLAHEYRDYLPNNTEVQPDYLHIRDHQGQLHELETHASLLTKDYFAQSDFAFTPNAEATSRKLAAQALARLEEKAEHCETAKRGEYPALSHQINKQIALMKFIIERNEQKPVLDDAQIKRIQLACNIAAWVEAPEHRYDTPDKIRKLPNNKRRDFIDAAIAAPKTLPPLGGSPHIRKNNSPGDIGLR